MRVSKIKFCDFIVDTFDGLGIIRTQLVIIRTQSVIIRTQFGEDFFFLLQKLNSFYKHQNL